MMNLYSILFHVEHNIRSVEKIISELLLDHVSTVSCANNEVVDSMGGIDLHDMPEDGFSYYFQHGLRSRTRFFLDSCAQPSH